MNAAPLLLAVPSKGRLQQNAESFFAHAGLELIKPRGSQINGCAFSVQLYILQGESLGNATINSRCLLPGCRGGSHPAAKHEPRSAMERSRARSRARVRG